MTDENSIPLTRIQSLIGRLMMQSKHQKPCVYLQATADLTELVQIRKPLCKKLGYRVTTNDFFFCAIGRAIAEFPLMAAHVDDSGDYLEVSSEAGLGFAVAAPQGLVVPVIKDISRKSLGQIAHDSNVLLKKARSNRLVPSDFDGANLVLSGLGMYGIHSFYAIAPPSSAGIISIGIIEDHIVATADAFLTRKKMCVALAVDRRVVNEFYAAQFLTRVTSQLEVPLSMVKDRPQEATDCI